MAIKFEEPEQRNQRSNWRGVTPVRTIRMGPHIYQGVCDFKFCNYILEAGNNATEDHSIKLAGNLDVELLLPEEYQENIHGTIFPAAYQYVTELLCNRDPGIAANSRFKLMFGSTWINYQKAYDYNPPHNHSGDLSYVIFIDVPDEMHNEPQHPNKLAPGSLTFRHGLMHNKLIDNKLIDIIHTTTFPHMHIPRKGDIFIFPAWLEHGVDRFLTPNITRISISGNINVQEVLND